MDARGRRGGASFCLGAGSESGDFEALVEVEGIERRPERRGSLGESGGPIVAACAIIPRDFGDEKMDLNTGRAHNPLQSHNKTLSVRRGLPFSVTPIRPSTGTWHLVTTVTTRLLNLPVYYFHQEIHYDVGVYPSLKNEALFMLDISLWL